MAAHKVVKEKRMSASLKRGVGKIHNFLSALQLIYMSPFLKRYFDLEVPNAALLSLAASGSY